MRPNSQRSTGAWLTSAALLACQPADTHAPGESSSSDATSEAAPASSTSSGEPSTGTTGAPITDGCACVFPGQLKYDPTTCGLAPSVLIEVHCHGNSQETGGVLEGGPEVPPPPECDWNDLLDIQGPYVDAALDLLIAGTPAVIKYRQQPSCGCIGFLVILPERRGLVRMEKSVSGALSEAVIMELQSPAYFEGCKAMGDPLGRFECLKRWTTGDPLALCEPPSP